MFKSHQTFRLSSPVPKKVENNETSKNFHNTVKEHTQDNNLQSKKPSKSTRVMKQKKKD